MASSRLFRSPRALERTSQVIERRGHVGVGLVLAVEYPTHLEALLEQFEGSPGCLELGAHMPGY